MRAAVTSAPIILFAGDRNGIITCHEGRELQSLGWKGGENMGKSVADLFKNTPEVMKAVSRVLEGEEISTVEVIGRHTFDVWYTPERDAHCEVSGYVGLATNIRAGYLAK